MIVFAVLIIVFVSTETSCLSLNYRNRLFNLDKVRNRRFELHCEETASLSLRSKFQFYNTLTRRKEKFIPLRSPYVSFYSCGPTVYDFAHIGNFRAFLTYDILKRWLMYCSYDVNHVCNLTDVDDKIIVKMLAENKTLKDVTEKYSSAFFDDLRVLNIIKANSYPKATEHIEDIKKMIDGLIASDHAYIENGSVYFRVSSFPDYGKLANLKLDEITPTEPSVATQQGPNERRGMDEKRDARDFALWKAFNPSGDGDVTWNATFGQGRPGWHIECSAMCNRLLGPSIDIHAGGVDLVFPHHQNELAQSEAFSGQQFSRYWLHNGFVNINNEKMSKSLQNFKTLRDIISKPSDARAFRFMVVTAQYRNPLNFNAETLQSAINSMKRIDRLVENMKSMISSSSSSSTLSPTSSSSTSSSEPAVPNNSDTNSFQSLLESCKNDFEVAMSDDLNTPRAVAAMFRLINAVEKSFNKKELTKEEAKKVLEVLSSMDAVFGVLYDVPEDYFSQVSNKGGSGNNVVSSADCDECGSSHKSPNQLEANLNAVKVLADRRRELKANKQFKEADEVRNSITELGYGIKDTKDGYDIFLL